MQFNYNFINPEILSNNFSKDSKHYCLKTKNISNMKNT